MDVCLVGRSAEFLKFSKYSFKNNTLYVSHIKTDNTDSLHNNITKHKVNYDLIQNVL